MMKTILFWLVVCIAGSSLTGCAQMLMSQPSATIENTQISRGIRNASSVALGDFAPDSDKPTSFDQKVSIRTNKLRSPINNSFSQYLRETLRVELVAAGLLDENSSEKISGVLIDSQVEAPVGTGFAALKARFIVTRSGEVRYDKILSVEANWASSFMGVSAIPIAAGQYEMLYRKLVGNLLKDPDFEQAISNRM